MLYPRESLAVCEGDGDIAATANAHVGIELFLHALWALGWLTGAAFAVAALAGFLSPETLSTGLRGFLWFWLVGWLVGGAFLLRSVLSRIFSRLEIIADDHGFDARRVYPWFQTSKTVAWSDLVGVAEFSAPRKIYRGVMLYTSNGAAVLDNYLSSDSCQQLIAAIESARPTALATETAGS